MAEKPTYDITARKQAEKALRESEEKYRQLFELISDAIFLVDKGTGQILEINSTASQLYGYSREELLQKKNVDLSAEPEQTRKATLEPKERIPTRYHRKKDGSVFPVEITATHLSWQGREVHIAAIRDITLRMQIEEEKKKLQAQLQHALRMESIGTLAGGIAHDFNNILMGIQGNASLILLDIDSVHSHYEKLKNIEQYVKNGADLTKQLLGFARGGKYEVKPTSLNDLLKKTSEMFGRTKKEISIYSKYQEDLWAVEVDQSQIEQILLNLFVNAWQSMPGGGELYLETKNVILDERHAEPHQMQPGDFVKLSVVDTGEGMDETTRQRVFEPFYTTKGMGRGTGLGLASAYGIIKNHGGIIDVSSRKGEGSTFDIYLPASKKTIFEEKAVIEKVYKGTETVLLVDDEKMVIDVGKKILEKFGYKAIVAKSGKEALDIYEGKHGGIDMVILDMIMPEMGGSETYDMLKTIDPQVKVLLSSGYSIGGQAREILNRGCNGFTQKPFDVIEITRKIREILDQ